MRLMTRDELFSMYGKDWSLGTTRIDRFKPELLKAALGEIKAADWVSSMDHLLGSHLPYEVYEEMREHGRSRLPKGIPSGAHTWAVDGTMVYEIADALTLGRLPEIGKPLSALSDIEV